MNYFHEMGIVDYWKVCLAAITIVCGAFAAGGSDTVSVSPPIPEPPSASGPASATVLTKPAPESEPPPEPVSYAGAKISAFVPGGGQLYRGRYLPGVIFLAAEATAIGVSAYWFGEADWQGGEASRMGDSVSACHERWLIDGDSSALGRSVHYSVLRDRTDFEAREARFTACNALAWAAGIHLYSFMDALGFDGFGLSKRGLERDPTSAGFLAAVPFLGLGQLYNGYPGKAGMISMTQISLAVMAGGHHSQMNRASARHNEMRDPASPKHAHAAEHQTYWKSQYDRNFSRRNTYLWVSLFVYIYSIFDAVVDAHLSDYDERISVGTDLAVGIDEGARVGLTLTFGLRNSSKN